MADNKDDKDGIVVLLILFLVFLIFVWTYIIKPIIDWMTENPTSIGYGFIIGLMIGISLYVLFENKQKLLKEDLTLSLGYIEKLEVENLRLKEENSHLRKNLKVLEHEQYVQEMQQKGGSWRRDICDDLHYE